MKIILIPILLAFFLVATSCVVLIPKAHHDNGKHKGWYKQNNGNAKAGNGNGNYSPKKSKGANKKRR